MYYIIFWIIKKIVLIISTNINFQGYCDDWNKVWKLTGDAVAGRGGWGAWAKGLYSTSAGRGAEAARIEGS